MPMVNIDGKDIDVAAGTTIIRAALDHGIDIPYYCWHPRLSVAANCRMCLVEVEKAPKLLPACEVQCRDGMVVKTRSQTVLDARASVMEFLLVNHPIDCPICDQAGECKLQDYYMKHDRTGTRFDEVKVPKEKVVELGPLVMMDEERCINCTRCVRFMDEIAENPQLGQFDRGDRAMIGTFPGRPLDDPYSLNTVEICPVGALTSRDFRFKVRSWFLESVDSVCGGCAKGCNIIVDHYEGEVQRYRARDNEHVNQGWLCDAGRLDYRRIHDPETQISVPHAMKNGELVPISWDEARIRLAELLGPFVGETDGTLGLALSAQLTTEGVTAFIELAEQVLQVDTYAILGRGDWEGDDFLRVADRNPNRAGAELVLEGYSIFDEGASLLQKGLENGAVKTLLMVGGDHPAPADEAWLAAVQKAKLVAWAPIWNETIRRAELVLPMAAFPEQDGTFVNGDGRMQRIKKAIKPIAGRPPEVEAATFTANALGAGREWRINNWITAFNQLKRHTNLLEGISAPKIGPWGVTLESDDVERSEAEAAEPRAAG